MWCIPKNNVILQDDVYPPAYLQSYATIGPQWGTVVSLGFSETKSGVVLCHECAIPEFVVCEPRVSQSQVLCVSCRLNTHQHKDRTGGEAKRPNVYVCLRSILGPGAS